MALLNNNESKTDLQQGLTSSEAKKRLEKYGLNTIKANKKDNIFLVFLKQFKDFMIILLLIATVFSYSVAIYEYVAHSDRDQKEIIISFIEPTIILIVVVLNSMLGTYQEIKSNQAVRALENSNKLNAKVIRDGILQIIPAEEVVIGDLIVVEAGDSIPADAKIIESFSFNVVESALTGESLSVEKKPSSEDLKHLPLGDQTNMIFLGTNVVNGRATAIVIATEKDTEMGKINKSIQEQTVNLTPLQIKLEKLSKIFGISGVILLFVTALAQILLTNAFSGNWSSPESYSNSIVVGISLAIAAIPEGLITFTTVLLAIGVAKMTKRNAIIKSFPAIETLGSTNIICSDKTGTLTENKMTVVDFYDNEKPELKDKFENSKALWALVGCCDASINVNEKGELVEVGDPTETGILKFGLKHNISSVSFFEKYNKIASLPFDSDRKMMSILVGDEKEKILITKGAPDVIFSKCNNYDQKFSKINEQWSNKAYRVIAVAYKKIDPLKTDLNFEDENNLTFLGLVAMIDPPRETVKQSIKEALSAGIKPVMITGDHLTTAIAIAKSLNIYKDGDLAITGTELTQMDDKELFEKINKISVYARVNPSDKLRIVEAWQSHNQVVAMTGDGVNDAPALKRADIGCAMGITGTDVSKQAADVILTDDRFDTIVKAVKTGRETFDKVKTVIMNLLVSSIAEILIMLFGLFIFRFAFNDSIGNDTEFLVLSASQLLWVNLLTHGLPAIALGIVDNDVDVMSRKPFSKKDSIFAHGMGKKLIIQSVIISLLSLLSYLIVALVAKQQGIIGDYFVKLTSTAAFVTLGISASINSLNLMSSRNIILCKFSKYKWVYLASTFSLICVLLSAFVPGLRDVFRNADISLLQDLGIYNHIYWIIPILLGFGLLIYCEIEKIIYLVKKHLLNK
ncbi:cation-translocating P-type ATPase [Mesomycoplasma lagogenitalium]|uniref:Cation-translocating P-type ATPase n=1 Tax=Mesomycoplasma lagogenitalium TaxID=171286 RepID=A0ABY8LWM6_9BACT|nr:cation-translocating P-type ATPase [Mesomycoplasma lagogenitalium]WGI36708.1 cation-translocating P-type ATPase [Mesomycoplasma lagogenitalium]